MAVLVWMLFFSLLLKDGINFRLERDVAKGELEVTVKKSDHGVEDEQRFFFNWLSLPNMTGAIIDVSLGPIKLHSNVGDVGKEPDPIPPNPGKQCTSNNTWGTCFPKDKCQTLQGAAMASDDCTGQLTCCTFTTTGCGVRMDKPYALTWNSPPNPASPQDCALTIGTSSMKSDKGANICRLRVDYKKSLLSSPDSASGKCTGQKITYQGTKSPVPEICGTNDNQHIYVEPAGDVVIKTVGFREFGNWKIVVTPIPCDTPALPPANCLQYFKESMDIVTSFGYQPTPLTTGSPTRQLAGLKYDICFNKTATCKLVFTPCKVPPGTLPFSISGNSGDIAQAKSAVGRTECPDTGNYLLIPGSTAPDSRVCGNRFNAVSGQTADGSLETTSNSITYVTSADGGTTNKGNLGFCLNYQIKC